MMTDERVILPVPLQVGWHLLSRVSCPQCQQFMNFESPTDAQKKAMERDMYCPTSGCPQNGTVYQTKLTVDGLIITGVR